MAQHLMILALNLLAGMALGLFFFGGLWWTLKRLAVARKPGLLMSISLLLRSALMAAGLYLLSDAQIERLLAALAGMVIARLWLHRRIAARQAPRRLASAPSQ